jgi:VIT1/CCC1 family predicted Fe2+/Mn2+ transporter
MSVLDTFYLLFKTDIPQAARADIASLDKQIDDLTTKGKKRTDQETSSLKTLQKQRKEATDEIKSQKKQVDELGQSFVKMVEGIAGAATAYLSFEGLKSGLLDAQKLNNALTVQAKLTGQNAGELRGYAQALENAGGSGEAFLSYISAQQQQAASANIKLPPADVLLQRLHNLIKGKDITQQTAILGAAGAQGLAPLLEQSDEEFAKSIESIKKHAAITNEASAASREFDRQWKQTGATFTDVFSKIDEDVLPILSSLLKGLENVGNWLTGHEHVAEGLFTGLAVGATVFSGAIVSALVPALGTLGVAAAVALGPLAILLTTITAVGVALASHKDIAAWLDKQLGNDDGVGDTYRQQMAAGGHSALSQSPVKRSQSKVGQTAAEKQSYDFWISQGYSPSAAAGLVANEKRESGFQGAGAVGDSGLARGAFQWHPDRQQKILAATGIDVRSAGPIDQLKAAAWELENSGLGQKLKNVQSPEQAGALISSQFERPANGAQEALIRAQMAAKIAQDQMAGTPSTMPWAQNSQTIGGDRSTSIKIDNVNVQTQATDPAGIAQSIGPALQNEFRNTISNFDDGVST